MTASKRSFLARLAEEIDAWTADLAKVSGHSRVFFKIHWTLPYGFYGRARCEDRDCLHQALPELGAKNLARLSAHERLERRVVLDRIRTFETEGAATAPKRADPGLSYWILATTRINLDFRSAESNGTAAERTWRIGLDSAEGHFRTFDEAERDWEAIRRMIADDPFLSAAEVPDAHWWVASDANETREREIDFPAPADENEAKRVFDVWQNLRRRACGIQSDGRPTYERWKSMDRPDPFAHLVAENGSRNWTLRRSNELRPKKT